jgi:hypothetical protein
MKYVFEIAHEASVSESHGIHFLFKWSNEGLSNGQPPMFYSLNSRAVHLTCHIGSVEDYWPMKTEVRL